ncbi:RNB domain-containing protein [Drepanopeziza brunnea f. sp. 'multigermtubi' MB_m1]|uniref:RNB domain-containing protein n=2 Tax=Drepanopeziza brunnea f. sp. 'multigermtubi' TaxID=698441 RepID=K1WY24_MARBU|nr:RNB domain-containing protein [Drepanopeziza brunnea f. sp. 'multigermtubi' MB_m1]EKD17931.1 RNB domain-containing protein [Drepanopeziza brunnea f. sp. 'multigermtubi' MB_m1]
MEQQQNQQQQPQLQPQQAQQHLQPQSQSGVSGPNGRRLHIAHRRSPSELTPLMSMFSSPGMEQLAIQQQIELLQQQQQQIQATHQQYVNMGMIPPTQHLAPGYNPLQQQMQGIPQNNFQFPNQMQQQQMNVSMGAPTQPLSHRRNQSALPNMGMGPPPAPSSGASASAFDNFGGQQRGENAGRGGRGGGPPGGGHQRRHSLALPEAKKAAELAQQKRTTSGFQFPIPGAAGGDANDGANSPPAEEKLPQAGNTGQSTRGRGGGHGRSQSMAVNGRGGGSTRGGGSFQFPPMQATVDAGASGQSNDIQRRGSGNSSHTRQGSRNFEGNWRNQPQGGAPTQDQGAMGNFQGQGGFQPGHRNRGSSNQSINSIPSFQYGGQPQIVPMQPGQLMVPQMYAGQQLNPLQISQLQALQAAQMNGQVGLQGSQHAPHMSGQHQQQQRKTLFTPYLPQATLPALLGDGQLVSGILRVNKKNRSDAYVTTQDGLLDADIFICGSKDRNRALEGDLVAVELLDVDEVWGQKREKEEKKKRKDVTDSRGGSNNNDRSHRDNSTTGDEQPSTGEGGGLRRRGSLRQRPTQKKNDDVEVEGQSLLLVEEEEVNDEQKPLYAGHIVAVVERVAGQMFSGTLGLLRPSSQATKEKQEAERQARDGNSGRHQEQRQQDKPKIVWFKPTDKRVPLIAIPTEQAPRDFVEKHQDYADRIFVACIKRWPITSLHPFGTLVEQLGKMGELKVETDALLRDNNFASDEFSDAVTRSVGLDEWSIEKEDEAEIAARRDFRNEKTFTIDPNGADELDDAIHVKTEEEDGKIEIGIHIADVAHFIKANSLVDREARKRGSAVYLMNRSCAMLPPKIASEICSLVPGQDRLTVSVVFKVNAHTGMVSDEDTWIGKSIIKSAGKLTYKEVDAVLSGHLDTKLDGADVREIQILNAVSQKWRERRLGTEGETITPLRLIYQLDDENVPVEQNIFDSTPSHELIEELMHKANAYVAQRIFKGLPEKALLRRQGPPNPRRLQTFISRMNKIGYEIDATTSGTLQTSLFKVDDTQIRLGMETLLVKAMHRAKYFIAGKTPAHLYPHYALNFPLYTHFTNPSRRYADLVVHRQLEAVLSEGKIEFNEDIETLVKTTESCNTKKDSSKNAQEQSVHIESCRIMDRKREAAGGELISEGIVLAVYDSAFDVLIPEYGFEKRVHCDQLPLKKAEFRKNDRILELYWEKGVPSSIYIPEDERPRAGASQRMTNAAAAAKKAAVAERAKKEHEEAQRKQMETGTISTDDVDALFDDEDDVSDVADSLAGVSLNDRPTQSVPPSPTKNSLQASGKLHRTRSDSKVPPVEPAEAKLSAKEKYLKFFTLREENGEYIQDVKEMTRVPVILKTDLTKSPPCLTIRSLNPYAL